MQLETFNEVDAARFLFDHPAFKHGSYNRFDRPDNDWVREQWTEATMNAMLATGSFFDPELFAKAIYEHPTWGYKQAWGVNPRVCKPFRTAAADLIKALA